ncbi:unnamed protein product [Schistocephalus solidus]|uniref:Uncharacterized protein n=1 Tax=Schistocephalus solidus TaxID=70667 RepID=A0A183SN31_SCHSO|nr:unnamed protein product [Schistocephalus solidus]
MSLWVFANRGQKRRYKDTEELPEASANQTGDLAQGLPSRRSAAKTGAAIYETNRIANVKAKKPSRTSQVHQIPTDNA